MTNISRSRIIFGVVAVGLIVLIAFVIRLIQTDPPEHWQKQIAINLAWEELLKHYPDGKSFDITYMVYDVRPRPDKGPNIWQVTYDLPDGPSEQMIWITVDVETVKVILFYKAES